MGNKNCISYNPSWIDLIIPSYKILFKFCTIRDKTNMFITSIVRLFIICVLFYYLLYAQIIEWNMNNPIKTTFFCLILAYIFVNILYIIVLLFKMPVVNSQKIKPNINTYN